MKTVRYRLVFPSNVLGEPFMYRLSHDMNIVPNILRGKITSQSAWLDVEMEGDEEALKSALVFLSDNAVTVEDIPQEADVEGA